jgi:hypothetical protein
MCGCVCCDRAVRGRSFYCYCIAVASARDVFLPQEDTGTRHHVIVSDSTCLCLPVQQVRNVLVWMHSMLVHCIFNTFVGKISDAMHTWHSCPSHEDPGRPCARTSSSLLHIIL